MAIKTYGYIRVSSADQNEIRQLIAMRERNVPKQNIYLDKQSGKDFDRPQYQNLVSHLQPGDILYLMSIDRLGRNYEEILVQWLSLIHICWTMIPSISCIRYFSAEPRIKIEFLSHVCPSQSLKTTFPTLCSIGQGMFLVDRLYNSLRPSSAR